MALDKFKCCQCQTEYDEFEFNDAWERIDGDKMCMKCRNVLGQVYGQDRIDKFVKIYDTGKRIMKPHRCILCGEDIPKGSTTARYIMARGERKYFHDTCPPYRQAVLEI